MEEVNKLPFCRAQRNLDISKRTTWLIKIGGILGGFILCALVCTILKPGTFLDFFQKLAYGSFGSSLRLMAFLEETALLLIISLALTPAFRMKFWNIGAEGQVLAGALGCYVVIKYFGQGIAGFPQPLLWVMMLLASILFSVIWSVIPAFFKAFFNTNETLFTLMMNYLIAGLILYFISVWAPNGSGVLEPVTVGIIPPFVIDGVAYDYIVNVIVVAFVTVLVAIYLKYTKHGYEIDVVGGSQNTARYIGINVKKVIIRTLVFSGIICGIAGFLLTVGATHTISSTGVGGRGFTAVLICWLSNLNPLEMVLSSALVAFISKGSSEACSVYFSNGSNFTEIMVGIFFFTIIASTFFTKYSLRFPRLKAYIEEKLENRKKLKTSPEVPTEDNKEDK